MQCSAVLCYAMLLGWVGLGWTMSHLGHESFGSWAVNSQQPSNKFVGHGGCWTVA